MILSSAIAIAGMGLGWDRCCQFSSAEEEKFSGWRAAGTDLGLGLLLCSFCAEKFYWKIQKIIYCSWSTKVKYLPLRAGDYLGLFNSSYYLIHIL